MFPTFNWTLWMLTAAICTLLLQQSAAVPEQNETTGFLSEDGVRTERHALKGNKWINGIVPYTINPSFPRQQRELIHQAIQDFATKTCIRFVPKTRNHRDYVDIQYDRSVDCGVANICRWGRGMQFAKIGRNCINDLQTYVHELAHSICMAHEHKRADRDEYVVLNRNRNPNHHDYRVEGSDYTTLGLLYDYESVMHYPCPIAFRPKSPHVTGCRTGRSLSVLDAEKINAFYNCGGCFSYRFRQPHGANRDLVQAGYDTDGQKLFVCRAYVYGEIIPGKYRMREGKCHIPWGNREHVFNRGFEVLTLPNPQFFTWEVVRNGRVPSNAVAGGRVNGKVPLYIGRCEFSVQGRKTLVPGKIHNGRMYFTFGGKEYKCQDFQVFTCRARP